MKRPEYWEAPKELTRPEETEPETPGREDFGGLRIALVKLGGFFLIVLCVLLLLFLKAVLAWWALLLLALVAYPFLHWLGGEVFADRYGWSTSQVGFSFTRIIFGVLLGVALFGVAYLIFRLARWLLAPGV